MATADLMLGEWVPDMHLVFQVGGPPCNIGASRRKQAVASGSNPAMDLPRTVSAIMQQKRMA